MVAFDLRPNVVSIDIDPVVGVIQTGVQYVVGDANNLAPLFTPNFVANLPRPWFVIEDSNHFPATCRAVLDFFHTQLKSGEHITVEDGIVTDFEVAYLFNRGPTMLLRLFGRSTRARMK